MINETRSSRALGLGLRSIVFGALLSMAQQALAGDRLRLVLLSDSSGELVHRVRAEARDLGMDLVEDSAPSAGANLADLAQRHAAIGVIRVASPSTVELWFAEHEAVPARYELVHAEPGEERSFALRVVEQIHADLLALSSPAHAPKSAPVTPEPATVESGQPSTAGPDVVPQSLGPHPRPKMSAGAAIGSSLASGGMGPTLHGALALEIGPFAGWIGKAEVLLPLTTNTFSGPEGSASADVTLLAGAIDHIIWRQSSWSAAIGAGAGASLLHMRSDPAPGYVGASDQLTVAVFFLDTELGSELTPWLSWKGSLFAGASAPRPVVRFNGHEVAAWGRMFAAGFVALSVGLPIGAGEDSMRAR